MERDYEYTSKCHLKDIKDAEILGKLAAEQTIRKLSPCLLYTSPSPRD